MNGSAGHSSRIRQEVSAIHEASRLVLWLENKMNTLVAAGHVDDRFSPPHTSLHIGIFHGGIAPNVIADKAHFYWDLRTIPMDDAHAIRKEFEAHCREREKELRSIFPGFKIELKENHPAVPPLDTKEDEDIVHLIKRLTGNENLNTVSYAAEAGQFAEAGFQSIICGPGSIIQAHRANEFIAIDQLHKGVKLIHDLIDEMTSTEFV